MLRAATGTTLTGTAPTELAKLDHAHRPAATPAGTPMTAAIPRVSAAGRGPGLSSCSLLCAGCRPAGRRGPTTDLRQSAPPSSRAGGEALLKKPGGTARIQRHG